mmetsp:Transcript_2674/g.4854  ORF Transcript_2674/g.4854 Transcript_2674/m.4854 type:complete len:321 (-) Transcript_2674:1431-2393(-)
MWIILAWPYSCGSDCMQTITVGQGDPWYLPRGAEVNEILLSVLFAEYILKWWSQSLRCRGKRVAVGFFSGFVAGMEKLKGNDHDLALIDRTLAQFIEELETKDGPIPSKVFHWSPGTDEKPNRGFSIPPSMDYLKVSPRNIMHVEEQNDFTLFGSMVPDDVFSGFLTPSLKNERLSRTTHEHKRLRTSFGCVAPGSKSSQPSLHCHLCGHKSDKVERAICSGLRTGICRKSVCIACFIAQSWDIHEALRDPEWKCPHCRNVCPARAQCVYYKQTNLRRTRRIAPRVPAPLFMPNVEGYCTALTNSMESELPFDKSPSYDQ